MQTDFSHKQLPFWILTIAIVGGLTAPFLVREGMFLDGALYSAIAQNLSKGIGSFWFPVFSRNILAGHATFHEHPPLGFAIQACLYRIIGHGRYAERLYIALTLCINAALIAGLWWRISRSDLQLKAIAWLPILIWIAAPTISWSFRNNMCENTMSIFVLAAIWILYDNMERAVPSLLRYIFAALCIFCASLTKGVPGMFPLAFPAFYFIALRRHTLLHTVYTTSILLLTVIVIYGIILSFPGPGESLHIYFFERLIDRVRTGSNVGSHFALLSILSVELIIPFILCFIAFMIYRRRAVSATLAPSYRLPLLFLLIALSGSLPLMLTRMQRAYYFVTVMPYFAIAVALFIAPLWMIGVKYIQKSMTWYRGLMIASLIAIGVITVICIATAGTPYRDANIIHDVEIIGVHIPHASAITPSEKLKEQFSVGVYLMRYFDIYYSNPGDRVTYYFFIKGESFSDPAAVREDWGLRALDVYELRK